MEQLALARIVGAFKGTGKGSYPTIKSFEYGEEVVFARLGSKPIFSYVQRTWNLATDAPMHCESGYLRVFDDNVCEFVIAQPTGLAEIEHGRMYVNDDDVLFLDLESGEKQYLLQMCSYKSVLVGQETKEGGKGLIRGDRNTDPKTLMVVRRFQLRGIFLFFFATILDIAKKF
jgi:hypothetical protein